MTKICSPCQNTFEITPYEQALLKKLSPVIGGKTYVLPEPSLCHPCRRQIRLTFRNERSLYLRTCDLTGKKMVSIYHPKSRFKVFSVEAWYSDQWNPLSYGRDYDPKRSFFEQYGELQTAVPRMSLIALDNENSPYVNHTWHLKNCHLSFDMGYCEDAMYCYSTYHSRNVLDLYRGEKMELCYECIDCSNCYQGLFLQDCSHCSDAYFSYDCHGCRNILFCSNLRNKENCINNQPVSVDIFRQAIQDLKLKSHTALQRNVKRWGEVKQQAIHKANHHLNCTDCTGNYLENCKNCYESYDSFTSQDCLFMTRSDEQGKDILDTDHLAQMELGYQSICISGYRVMGCYFIYHGTNLFYSEAMVSCKDCFGCSNLKQKQYCILNKQYRKEEYEKLVSQIIENMQKRGEWGQFFPKHLAPFGYNECLVNEIFPLSREEALAKGFLWTDYKSPPVTATKSIPAKNLPDTLDEVSDDVLNWAIVCEKSKKLFKLTPQELHFYRRLGLSIPRLHPDERHERRYHQRTPQKLFSRNCAKCQKEIQTSYSKERPEIVYCVECYLKEVY